MSLLPISTLHGHVTHPYAKPPIVSVLGFLSGLADDIPRPGHRLVADMKIIGNPSVVILRKEVTPIIAIVERLHQVNLAPCARVANITRSKRQDRKSVV